MTGAVQVRTATESDIPEMAAMMGRTFQDGDAVGEFMFPDPAQRQVRQRRMFQALMKYRYVPERRADVAVADNGKIVGVVLWDRSWTRPHVGRKVAENIALLVAMRSRVVAGLLVEAAAARGAPKERHLYVMYIGVDPDWHGYAPARHLVGCLRERADAERAGLYGNCLKKLLPFYAEAFPEGRLTGTTTLGRSGPVFYFLYRDPVR